MSINRSYVGQGRLSISAALGRDTSLDSSALSTSSHTSSATAAKYERQIKNLKEENSKLRKDLEYIKSLYNQLTSENSHEKFDERRIMLLKSQVIQLERQVLQMSEALSSRSEALLDVENALTWLTDKWRYYISLDVKGPEVGVQRSEMTQMVHTAESARIKLYKQIERSSVDKLTHPAVLMEGFLKPGCEKELTFLDIASGRLEHLNLKHVGKLESKLASLYKEMTLLYEIMNDSDKNELDGHHTTSKHMTDISRDRLCCQILKSCAMMKDCCGDLGCLSLLYPAAPWPPLKKNMIKEVTYERVMASLPALPRGRTTEVGKVIQALITAFNYRNHLMSHEMQNLKEEVKFHKSVYNLQLTYIDSLFKTIKEGYSYLEKSTDDVIVQPMKEILELYANLKETASESALKDFLSTFEQNFEQMQHAIDKLSLQEANGSEVFSQFGEEFFGHLDKLVKKCQLERDKAVKEKHDLKKQQEEKEEELKEFLDQQENKYQNHSALDCGQVEEEKLLPERQDVMIYLKERDKHKEENVVIVQPNLQESVLKQFEQSLRVHGNTPFQSKPWNDSTEVEKSLSNSLDLEQFSSNFTEVINPSIDSKTLKNPWNDSTEVERQWDFPTEKSSNNSIETEEVNQYNNLKSSIQEAGLPPQGKSDVLKKIKKKPKSYTPNTFVPNRTLQLRKSGSMSKLDETGLLKKPHPLPKVTRPGSMSDAYGDSGCTNKEDRKSDTRSRAESRNTSSRTSISRSSSRSRKS